MPYVGKKNLEGYILMLNEIKKIATMEDSDFSNNKYGIPDFRIKEITELWRESWLVSPIEKIINYFEELIK